MLTKSRAKKAPLTKLKVTALGSAKWSKTNSTADRSPLEQNANEVNQCDEESKSQEKKVSGKQKESNKKSKQKQLVIKRLAAKQNKAMGLVTEH